MTSSYNGFSPEERIKGDKIVKQAIERGEIPPPNTVHCAMCGQTRGIRHYHQEDYSPENVVADSVCLCWRCHMMLHSRFSHPRSWHKYFVEVVLHKQQYPPVYNHSWNNLNQHLID